MSEQLRHKLIDFEVVPPPASWESIATRLDDDRQYAVIAANLHNFETAPPPAAWEFIATRLDDDRTYAVVAAKMNTFEATPPPQLWNTIAASLSDTSSVETSPVVSIRRIVYRALAAAVIIAALAGVWMLFNKSNLPADTVKNNPVMPAIPAVPKKDKTIEPGNTIAAATTEPPAAAQQQAGQNNSLVPLSAAAVQNDDRILKYAVVRGIPAFHETPITISSSPIVDENGVVIHDLDVLTANSNYIMVTGPNGQLTRISSKFASVIRYLNGNADDPEEYLDKVIKESDTWKKRFQEWRNKISQSSFIPSSANFLDIIEFKELIQE